MSERFFDTLSSTLARAGVTLSCEPTEHGQTWSVCLPAFDDLPPRRLCVNADSAAPPAAVRELVRAYVRGARLHPVATAEPRAHGPPDVTPLALGEHPTVDDVIRSDLSTYVNRLVYHHAGVRSLEDPEDVHQFRVATRRLRSDLRTFGALLDAPWAAHLRGELKWLAEEVGAVRDADVLAERLRQRIARLPQSDAEGLAFVLDLLAGQSRLGQAALLERLSSKRYVDLLDDLVDATHHVHYRPGKEHVPGAAAAPTLLPLVGRRWRRLQSRIGELGRKPSAADLHAVRIRAKRARYAIEAVAAVYGRPAHRLAAALGTVQDVLGEHQDAIVAEAWLRELAATHSEAALGLGMLIAAERHAQRQARKDFREIWSTASARKRSAWLR